MSADDCPDCEDFLADNNRLRAKVERLTAPVPIMSGGVVDWKAAYEFEYKRANELERERDRLQRSEAVVEAAKGHYESFKHHNCRCGVCFHVKALAAWEEGKRIE